MEKIFDLKRYVKILFPYKFKIFIKRPLLFLWLGVSFLVFWSNFNLSLIGFFITTFFYYTIIRIATSRQIESILRVLYDVRRLATNKEKERLMPIFNEVFLKISKKKRGEYFNGDISLYIIDTMSIEAFALGRTTIAISRGILECFDDEEIKAIIAHEFYHIVSGDTVISLLIKVATSFYVWIFIILSSILSYIEKVYSGKILASILGIINSLCQFSTAVLLLLWNILILGRSREREYRADLYTCKLGYSNEILSVLYKLYDMEISDKKKLLDRLQTSHPRTAFRIENIEKNCK